VSEMERERRGFGGPRRMYKATCADCGKECEVPFQPTEERPVYCRECLPKHRRPREFGREFGRRREFGGPREMHKAVCSDCGKACEVPFEPTPGKPVYCEECWEKHKPPRRY